MKANFPNIYMYMYPVLIITLAFRALRLLFKLDYKTKDE